MADEEPSYIDYETFLDPDFSPTSFANTLVLSTNDTSDTPLDLSTPLSRVLFDVQEIDTHIDTLTTKSAVPLLKYSIDQDEAAGKVLGEVEAQVASLTEAYTTLEKEVIERHEAAEQVRLAADRLCETVQILRAVTRCLTLGRQLDGQLSEVNGTSKDGSGNKKPEHRAMVRCANTILLFRQLYSASEPGEEGQHLGRIKVIVTLRNDLILAAERSILSRSQQIVREFSMSTLLSSTSQTGANTFSQTDDTRSKATAALLSLYLLSPTTRATTAETFDPKLLLSALQDYLQTSLKSSLASLSRSLATLPTLDRTLLEISARCQNIVALEALLESIKPPSHPHFPTSPSTPPNFLAPLLTSLDTASLPSYFWRSLASSLSSRVQEIMSRGGVSARTLRTNSDRVRAAIRGCVNRGSQLPTAAAGLAASGKGRTGEGHWEREAAVMVGAVIGSMR
ncbi:hypothetical protein P152DRAFT_460347 [Eremomyces bilateralis CBS 781.70]|uniref:Conserved oligomeric Golgi complex subunit 5 n=1 Tax=Eremomyces bilateralis CBS 781.70 TaxID=1392243 RepID=A0A6G1FXY3_9PEZI|nr:uncharacterized protein P152DRAFT_460347 [Eremomyces bilateralis CBS 781.70]KAF1810653.1 hypothetical protein P152DRAFT_460347 [Eremomyces bilateralis CBS 781.70]